MITMRQIWIKKDQTLRRDEIISGDGVRAIDRTITMNTSQETFVVGADY